MVYGNSRFWESTLANHVAEALRRRGFEVEVLDSGDIRSKLYPDLGFTPKDRDSNAKRIAWVANLLFKHGISVLIASLASSREHRERVRNLIKRFAIVYVRCPVSVCIQRDPQGLYAKAQCGELNNGRPGAAKTIEQLYKTYEEPIDPEVIVDTNSLSIEESVQLVMSKLESLHFIKKID